MNEHTFGTTTVDADDFWSVACLACGRSFGGDKPSDLWDVAEWAGECPKAVELVAARLGSEDDVLTHNPFAALKQ